MMINKRLISTNGRSKKYIAGNVIVQWVSLIFNIVMIFSIANLLGKFAENSMESRDVIFTVCAAVIAVLLICVPLIPVVIVVIQKIAKVAYGGAALGIIMAATEFNAGAVDFAGCFAIILLSADFFIPMRQLGSFFSCRDERNGGERQDFPPYRPTRTRTKKR